MYTSRELPNTKMDAEESLTYCGNMILTGHFFRRKRAWLVIVCINILVALAYTSLTDKLWASRRKMTLWEIKKTVFGNFFEIVNTTATPAINVHYIKPKPEYLLYQKCKIPKLDPYHPDVLPHINYKHTKQCDYEPLSRIIDGVLQVVKKDLISSAKFAYIRRVDDTKNVLSKWIPFYETGSKEDGFKLTEDFVKVDLIRGNDHVIEYHMYPSRPETKNKSESDPKLNLSRDPNKLNIVMLMIDSISHASGERYLKKTYKRLTNDENSIILKGHTIVGDGTTAQICAIFIGKQEYELKEARRGYSGASYVDRWPFIYSDFHKAGYKTLYSEDSPTVNTFNYRLMGFKDQPTTKYIRNFWLEANSYINQIVKNSVACIHTTAIRYVKNFLKVYSDTPTLTFAAFSELAHSLSSRAQLADKDFIEFFEYLEETKYLNNTIVILFGDHGDRSSAFRKTMQGKLEERLPLMTFTFPPWFKDQYPVEFANFKRNSDLLTSHFDIHSTLQHLLTFPENKHQHDRGKSLFTDLVSLNRTCSDVGVKDHWCSCLEYQPVNTNSSVVITIAKHLVDFINGQIDAVAAVKGKCQILKLKDITRARKIVANAKVQKFSQTFRNGKCDECGVKEASTNYKTSNYEIVFSVLPSDGVYETIAIYHEDTKKVTATDQISRVNVYGDQPKCVAKDYPYLRPYCYCKNSDSPVEK